MYSPTMMRWMQQDPMEYVDGASLYSLETNSPLNFLDPSGLQKIVVAFEGLGGYPVVGQGKRFFDDRAHSYVKDWGELVKGNNVDFRYFPEHGYREAAQKLESELKKYGSDRSYTPVCGYPTLVVLGYSNGGAAAIHFADLMKQKNIKIDAGVTVDPIEQFIGPLRRSFTLPPNATAAWANFFQRGDVNLGGVLRGAPVHGATNKEIQKSEFKDEDQYQNSHSGGHIAEHTFVVSAIKKAIENVALRRSTYKYR